MMTFDSTSYSKIAQHLVAQQSDCRLVFPDIVALEFAHMKTRRFCYWVEFAAPVGPSTPASLLSNDTLPEVQRDLAAFSAKVAEHFAKNNLLETSLGVFQRMATRSLETPDPDDLDRMIVSPGRELIILTPSPDFLRDTGYEYVKRPFEMALDPV